MINLRRRFRRIKKKITKVIGYSFSSTPKILNDNWIYALRGEEPPCSDHVAYDPNDSVRMVSK